MALVLANRVRETSTTTGTGTITLAGAVTGYQTFSAGIGANNTCYYTISNPGVAEWEVGLGTVGSPATTLARTTILASSNAGSAVNFSAGTKDVFVTYPSSKSVYLDASGNASALGTPASGTVTNLTGTASININGTVGATTPNTGAFTTGSFSGAVSFAAGTVSAPSIYLSTDTGTGFYRIGANNYGFAVSGSKVLDIASTGLSVTGTLGLTGSAATLTQSFSAGGTTTGANYWTISNTGGNLRIGVDNSTGVSLITGGTAYGGVVGTNNNTTLHLISNGTSIAQVTSTGLAVTGTLYSSGNFYSGGVANGQTPDATHAGQAITTSNQMYNSAGATSADSVLIRFYNTNGLVGTINVSGSATAYNTSSDQRLKEDLGISTDVSVLQNLKIHDFKWKVDGSQDRGVFAQEAYQVKPSAIRVGSDDIDKYGHLEKPWSADYSKFVPDLIVGWKNHEDRIARLEAALAKAGISLQ